MDPELRSPVDVRIEVASDTFPSDDDRWTAQVNELVEDLRADVGSVRKEVTAEPGTKGGAEAIILALGSAGAITAAVEMFKAWLARDRSRKIKLSVGDVVIEGEEIDADSVVKILQQAQR